MGNSSSARLLRLAVLAACSPLGCVGNQTFDDGSDELRKRGAETPEANSSDSGSSGPDAPETTEGASDTEEARERPAPPAATDGGSATSAQSIDETTSVPDAAAPNASSDTTDETTSGSSDTDVTAIDVTDTDVSGAFDAGSAPDARDLAGEVLSLTYADGLFVAVGASGEESQTGPNASWIITSEDGRNWTERQSAEEGLLWSVAHSAGRWVAVGWDLWQEGGTEWFDAHPVFVSDDGTNWQLVLVPGLSQPQQVISSSEGFVLLDGDDSSIWFSEDGEQWSARTSPGPVTRLLMTDLGPLANLDVPGLRLAAGRSDGYVSLSTDLAETWSDEALPLAEISVDRLWTNGVLQGVGSSDSCFGEDPSCRKTFSLFRDGGGSGTWSSADTTRLAYYPFTALVADGIEVSTDGERLAHRDSVVGEWTLVEAGENRDARFSEIVFGEGTFVAAGVGGLRYSDDGIEWHRYDSLASE